MSFSILAQTPPAALDAGHSAGSAASANAASSEQALRALQVMVVEDNDVNRELLTIMLEQLGHHVFAVADGEAAIEGCKARAFDAVLMDLNLPRIGGIEATRRILLEPVADSAPPAVIALTASVSDADRALCAAAGMRGFLTKPATVFSLDVALRGAVSEVPLATDLRRTVELLDVVTLDSLAELEQRAAEPFLQRLIDRFVEGLPAHVARLQAEWAAGQRDQVAATAHSMTGAAAAVGASALARAARNISEAPTAERVSELAKIVRETEAALAAWTSRRSASDSTE